MLLIISLAGFVLVNLVSFPDAGSCKYTSAVSIR
jgi:hypothetical protein